MYLEELVNSWYKFDTLGDSGSLLMIRYYSIPRGLLHPKAKLRQEIDLWIKSYNKRFCPLDLFSTENNSIQFFHS